MPEETTESLRDGEIHRFAVLDLLVRCGCPKDIAGMPPACYLTTMANIQVKNIPEKLHNRLRRYAREQESTLSEIVLEAIQREVARREWHKRFSGRPLTQLGSSAAELLEQERRQRNRDLS